MIAPIESSLPTPKEAMKKLCSDPKFVYLTSTYVIDFYKRRKGISCSVTPLPQTAVVDTLCFIVRKGSPYRDILNYKLVYYCLSVVFAPYLHVVKAYTENNMSTFWIQSTFPNEGY
jgi:hypothetical protein